MYELLIILTTRERIIIPKVSRYGICQDKDVFFFDKDKVRNFIPIHSVLYLGLKDLWPNETETIPSFTGGYPGQFEIDTVLLSEVHDER